MKKLLVAMIAVGLMALAGCAIIPTPTMGFIYTNIDYAGQYDGGQPGSIAGTISGEGCASNILGILATGDASLQAAIANGGGAGKKLANVRVDHHGDHILMIFGKYCTKVTADIVQ